MLPLLREKSHIDQKLITLRHLLDPRPIPLLLCCPCLQPTIMLVIAVFAFLAALSSSSSHVGAQMPVTFGTGWSQFGLTPNETTLFTHTLSPTSTFASMTHFWATGDSNIDTAIWRYYLDDEEYPSLEFQSAQVAGVGFVDQYAPWGNKWIGKGASGGAWYNNFRVPFHQNIRITGQLAPSTGERGTLWTIFRGSENLPITVGNYPLPPSARLIQSRILNVTYQPLDFVNLVSVPEKHSGVLWAHFLTAESTNENFMEGCYHAYTPSSATFPGLTVSTGTEDYFDSAFYFNAGVFHQENAGLTHLLAADKHVELSAYRLHDQDPIFFQDGFRFEWRVGDVSDSDGLKCTAVKGSLAGDPQPTTITAYTWVYTWLSGEENVSQQQRTGKRVRAE